MNYKEYKQKQKEDLEAYKQKLKADLDEFKEKLKIKLEKFKLKTKAKAKNTKKKPNKRKRKGGALRDDEKDLIQKFVNDVILINLTKPNHTPYDIINYLLQNGENLIKSELQSIRTPSYQDLNILIFTALASNRGNEREKYYIRQLEIYLIQIYGDDVGKALTKHFIILSICGTYDGTPNIYNIVYCLYTIISDIININFEHINFSIIASKEDIYELLLQSDGNNNIIRVLDRFSITRDMLKKDIILSLCRLLIPYQDEYTDASGNISKTINGMKHEAITDYIMYVAASLNRPSRPIPEDKGEDRGREGIVGRFFGQMPVAEDQDKGRDARGMVGRLRRAMQEAEDLGVVMDSDKIISSDVDTRTKDRGMICRIDDSQDKK